MGQSRNRLQQMKEKHPQCAFCAGQSETTSVEHMPSRILFDDKWRPRGLEFPSCQSCQDSTRKVEPIMAMVTRFFPGPKDKSQIDAFRQLARSAEHNNPGILAEMKVDQASVLSRIGSAAFNLPNWNFVNLGGPIVSKAIDSFSRKMAMALHFELTGNIVPEGARLFFEHYSNVDAATGEFPADLMEHLGSGRSLQMGAKHVYDQFAYRSARVDGTNITIHMVFYRQSLATLLIVYPEAGDLTPEDLDHTVPFFSTSGPTSPAVAAEDVGKDN
ncbi:hypothetical protein CFBP5877_18585 [Agrobacterium tumefaciens]|uniref:HNH endonuclease n=1 Tax=Agrobacterium tumefaciens TaxID=358 RepID=A0AAE6BFR6_AGRTU|nr:hypothetical protein [Agrobacterium tumefaciens]QCL81150.1 hypothetical protein CFBP5877_18585 [Agrobacterium tumefaciens]